MTDIPHRNEVHDHILRCQKKVEKCQVKGCFFWGTKEDMDTHMANNASVHVNLLTDENAALKEALFRGVRNIKSVSLFCANSRHTWILLKSPLFAHWLPGPFQTS